MAALRCLQVATSLIVLTCKGRTGPHVQNYQAIYSSKNSDLEERMEKQSLYGQEILIRAIEVAIPRLHYCRYSQAKLTEWRL